MLLKVVFVTFALVLQVRTIYCQRQWIPPTTTAAEMWNPYTWYWPYAIAASEAYRDYFTNAQQITNQLYQQAYITNAFWWTNNRPNQPNTPNVPNNPNIPNNPNVPNTRGKGAVFATAKMGSQAGRATGQAARPTGQMGSRPIANMAQGGAGWV